MLCEYIRQTAGLSTTHSLHLSCVRPLGLSLSCVEQALYLEGEVLDLKGQLADMEEIKSDMEGHIAELSQELAAAKEAAEKQASERSAALKVRGHLHEIA